jgi:hypothetical protein
VELTLYVSERVLNNGGSNLETLKKTLVFEGFIVHFRDASSEEVQFGESLPLAEMKQEEENEEGKGEDSGGGGCNAGWSMLLISFAPVVFSRIKKRN